MEGNIPTLLDCKTCLINNFISANTELLNIHNVTCKPNKIASLIKALKNNYSVLFNAVLGVFLGQ